MKKTIFFLIILGLAVAFQFRLFSQVGTGGSTWVQGDVGSVKVSGSSQQLDSIYAVSGSGGDPFGTADAFQFMHRSWSGDGVIVARVLDISAGDGGGKAALIFGRGLNLGPQTCSWR